jgi:universal stress protein E
MAHQHDKLEAVIFTPTDWHLLRKCPCPVWMVKDQPWPEGGKALVAVNLASEENYHDALNEKLVKETSNWRTGQPYRSPSGGRLPGNAD